MSVQYHIQLAAEHLQGATYVVLPGDPGRVAGIAQALDSQAKPLAVNREYTSYLAKVGHHNVLICSTGMGGPSTAICLDELAKIGIRYCLRVGTSGSIQPYINIGDFVITQASVRLDGTSRHYAPIEYPAVASHEMTQSLKQAMLKLGITPHIGITASSDTFYPGQERYDSFNGYVPRAFRGSLDEWRALNVLNYEMESASLLTVAKTFNIEASCFTQVIAQRTDSEKVDLAAYQKTSDMRNEIIREMLLMEFDRHA